MIKYPLRAAPALGFLKSFYNDVDIYIEDTTCHNMALFIFRAILPANVRLTSLNQLGGRDRVLAACKLDQQNGGRKRIYIIDGDLDLLIGQARPRLRHLYRLRSYCIENLVVSTAAVNEIALETLHNIRPSAIDGVVNHSRWLDGVVKALGPLFVLYAVARKLAPAIATVSLPVNQLYQADPGGPILSYSRIRKRVYHLMREIRKVASLNQINQARKMIYAIIEGYNPAHFLISGKDYLLPYLRTRLSALIRFHGSEDDLKTRLAHHYDIRMEPYLARRLRAVAR